jgi:predicted P-loop ATPase
VATGPGFATRFTGSTSKSAPARAPLSTSVSHSQMIPPSIANNSELRELSPSDYEALKSRWLAPDAADAAFLRRVDSAYGAEIIGQSHRAGDYSGLVIPYLWPGGADVVMYRLRRDHPDMEAGSDGNVRPRRKYLSPPAGANRLYFAPQTDPDYLNDSNLPLVVVEGEFKALALWRLAWYGLGDAAEQPAFLPVGLQGVWNWRGVVAKTESADGSRVDVKGPVPDIARIAWAERRVLILFDADVEKNLRVSEARHALTRELEGRGAQIAWFNWPPHVPESQKGIDDFLATNGPEPVIRLLSRARNVTKVRPREKRISEAVQDEEKWMRDLKCGDKGIKALLANAMTALRCAPSWRGNLAFNEFSCRMEVPTGTPWRSESYIWGEIDDIRLAEWLQLKGIEVTPLTANLAAEAVAREHSYHPVREYLDRLVWDREPRIDHWLQRYFGAADDPYTRAVGSKWLISAVARIMSPGCQADYCLILQGQQRIGKSSALRILGGSWFTDDVAELGTKEAALQLLGIWIAELGELSQIAGRLADQERVKSFLTRRVDHFRPPYGRRTADFPRQCVFAGTTNSETYFRDETGAGRFWPVKCGPKVDIHRLIQDRDQLWAEARIRWDLGETWFLEDSETLKAAEEEQDARFQRDPWDGRIWQYVISARDAWVKEGKAIEAFRTNVPEILQLAVQKKCEDWTRADSNRVCAIMRLRGFEYKRQRIVDASGKPVLGPDGKQLREYHFRWPAST